MDKNPNKMKNAIVVLTRGYSNNNQYKSLIQRNLEISKVILKESKSNFDFIIFHEGNISDFSQSYIKSFTPELDIIFQNVKTDYDHTAFKLPNSQPDLTLCPPTTLSNSFPLGYKHMCHFWAIDFLKFLKEYKYVIRIDEDCVVQKFNTNILDEMNDEQIFFISPLFQEQDTPFVILGMEKLRNKFCKENSIEIKTQFYDIKCPYTNFMIVDIQNILKNDMAMKFMKLVDECGCIYTNRWGDLPIWGLVLDTFFDKKNYKECKDITYFHGSHNKVVNT